MDKKYIVICAGHMGEGSTILQALQDYAENYSLDFSDLNTVEIYEAKRIDISISINVK